MAHPEGLDRLDRSNRNPTLTLALAQLTLRVSTASTGSVNVCSASPSTCAYQPRFTMSQSDCKPSCL